ncbi:MAG: DUF4397 domain-containing protein [Ornithinimicrobium sp.]
MASTGPLRVTALSAAALGVVIAGGLAAAPASAAQDDVTLYIVQGLADESVDISVDGQKLASGVETAEIAGPFTVDPGKNTWTFTDAEGEVLVENSVEAQAGDNSDVVLHLPAAAGDAPVLTVFENDLSAVPADKASLTVAHTAAVPPADIVVNDEVLFANVANGESLNLVVPVDTYSVQIVPTGETEPVIFGPLDLTVKGGALNRVFAVGDPEAESMNVVVHVVEVGEEGSQAPDVVNTGTGGQVATMSSLLGALSSVWR